MLLPEVAFAIDAIRTPSLSQIIECFWFLFFPFCALESFTSCTINPPMPWPCMRQRVCRCNTNQWICIVVAGKCHWPAIMRFIDERVSPSSSGLNWYCWNECWRHWVLSLSSSGLILLLDDWVSRIERAKCRHWYSQDRLMIDDGLLVPDVLRK